MKSIGYQIFALINMILGTGPLIIPAVFYQAGYLLSTIWLVIIGFISYFGAQFIIEVVERANHIKKTICSQNLTSQKLLAISQHTNQQQKIQVIQYAELGNLIIGRNGEIIIGIVVCLYAIGTISSKFIITINIMSNVFEKIKILQSSYFWLGVFFFAVSIFSFQNIKQTKILQIIIGIIRIIVITLLIGGAISVIITTGTQGVVPQGTKSLNFYYFPQLFSNTIYSLLCQHMLPGLMFSSKKIFNKKKVLIIAFLISFFCLEMLSMTAILGFGNQLGEIIPGGLNYYNFNFKQKLKVIYYVVSFYPFFNIALVPLHIIVLRKSLINIFSKESDISIKRSHLITIFILGLVLIIVIFARNQVQIVFDFTGGICGIFILLIVPTYLLIQSRKKTSSQQSEINNKSIIKGFIIPYILILVGIAVLGYNITSLIIKYVNK